MIRNLSLVGAFAASLVLSACGPSRPEPGKPDGSTGCSGASCNVDGGTGGTDGGTTPADAGSGVKLSLAQTRLLSFSAYQRVLVEGLVIHTVDDSFVGNSGRCQSKAGSTFWVVDPQQPTVGLQVVKDCEDLPLDYQPQVGDQVSIDGWFQARGQFDNFTGRRPVLRNEFEKFPRCPNNTRCPGKLQVFKTGTAAVPAPNVSDGGLSPDDAGRSSSAFAGTRVYVPGPVSLTDPRPLALKRISQVPGDDTYNGFEITGGVLVSDYKTFGETRDGGSERCDWRAAAVDGGQVRFPNGLQGVWDTYTFSECQDGGVEEGCFKRSGGMVPGTTLYFTHILYPQTCGDFDGGVITY